jgi:3-methylcrotonyl-CoA carboxylase alpha subunit
MKVEPLGRGVFLVEDGGRQEIVYVAGPSDNRWAFWNGQTYRRTRATSIDQSLTAPMPGTVIKVLVAPGDAVRAGATLLVLEAMKMEWPLRAPRDGVVARLNCREGELVQPDMPLVDLE